MAMPPPRKLTGAFIRSLTCKDSAFHVRDTTVKDFMIAVILILALTLFGTSTPSAAQPYAFLEITVPLFNGLNPASRLPVATYEWRTYGGSEDPVEVRWIIVPTGEHNGRFDDTADYIRNNPDAPEWSAWQAYNPPAIGTSWTSPPMDFGPYVFAVQGKDGSGNLGDLDDARNIRRVQVTVTLGGPFMRVSGDHINDILTANTGTPVTEIALSGETPVSFCWTADASFYGLPVTGYRSDWDLVDPDDDGAWGMPFTPFSQEQECSPVRVFSSGVHTFYVEVIDYDGGKSRVPIQITYTGVPVEETTWGRIKAFYKK